MAKRKKDELIRIILNQGNIDANENYDELIELLFDEPISINVNKEEKKTFGESVADKITAIAGSWTFILLFCGFLLGWILLNLFVFLNLGLPRFLPCRLLFYY